MSSGLVGDDRSAAIATQVVERVEVDRRRGRRRRGWLFGLGLAAVALIVATASIETFPQSWNLGLADPINDGRRWLISNQTGHWLYTAILDPMSAAVEFVLSGFESLLAAVPFWVAVALTGVALGWVRGRPAGLAASVGVFHAGAVGLWDDYVDTFALTTASVALALVIGVPLGVAAARNDAVRWVLRPVLDLMQTLPAFVYLIPFVVLFGIGLVPSVLATVIFAVPPVVRLTEAGIREVPVAAIEASQMFGATDRQTLNKVRLPLARSAILAGINQTILLAVSMVVIAGFIGAGGLGQVVLRSLRDLDVGRATEAGIAIVVMAIILDRFTEGLASAESTRRSMPSAWKLTAAAIAAAGIVCRAMGWTEPPEWLDWSYGDRVNDLVDWSRDNLYNIAGSGIGTGPFSDLLTIWFVTPLRELLTDHLSWVAIIAIAATLAGMAGGRGPAVTVAASLFGIGLLGMWELAMDTMAQVAVAFGLCVVVGVPVGVLAARRPRVERVLRPVLDFLQTIPSFVLLVPVIILFNVGRIPGIIAAVLYAIPVTIRLTTLALRSVPDSTVEAATVFGGTRRQVLRTVELPLARPFLLAALNQTTMLVLSMVVIAGLVGGGGLGLETVRGLRRTDSVGTGFEAGLAIVLLAIAIDRTTAAFAADQDTA